MGPAAALSRTLLAPVANLLDGAEHLIVAPDGILHYVPFEVLLTADPGPARDFGALPYLVRQIDVSYVPSVSALARLRAPRRRPPGSDQPPARQQQPVTAASTPAAAAAPTTTPDAPELLVLGDAEATATGVPDVYRRAALGDAPATVPSAHQEIAALRALFPGDRCRVLEGPRATVRALVEATQSARYPLIHIAAHGVFNERRPRFSGLLLYPTPGGADDGFLSVGEVFGIDLDCDQVLLAACSTALGEAVSGEGLIGLARAFLFAGAHSVVAALWEVSGEASAALVPTFYQEIEAGGGRQRQQALAEAKRRMIDGRIGAAAAVNRASAGVDLAHPCFWAAYVLIGDGD